MPRREKATALRGSVPVCAPLPSKSIIVTPRVVEDAAVASGVAVERACRSGFLTVDLVIIVDAKAAKVSVATLSSDRARSQSYHSRCRDFEAIVYHRGCFEKKGYTQAKSCSDTKARWDLGNYSNL